MKINVIVVNQNDREHLQARWTDPISGKYRYKTTGETNKRKADKFAAQLELKLNSGVVSSEGGISWEDFRKRYQDEHLSGLAESSEYKADNVLDGFARVVKVKKLKTITQVKVNLYITHNREKGNTEATINGNLACIKAALNWASDMGLLDNVPSIKPLKRAKRSKMMKGRPITGEEFDRIYSAIPKVIDQSHQKQWEFFIKGLWWSGLRLGEAINLTWNTGPFCVVEMDEHYYFMINSDAEKGNQDRLLSIAPEFEEMLREAPEKRGRVFVPKTKYTRSTKPRVDSTGKVIKRLSKNAKVISDTEKNAYATAHDFRRSFGERWAQSIMPQKLMELMRHSDIKTTLNYYVGKNAKATTNVLWDVYSEKKSTKKSTNRNNRKSAK